MSSWDQISLPIFQGYQTRDSTVPPIVNGSDWGCIVRDMDTIIVVVLLAFDFIPQRSHHSLTFQMSGSLQMSGSTATLTPDDGIIDSYQSGVITLADKRIFQFENLRCAQEEQ